MKITDLLSLNTIDLEVKATNKTDIIKQAVKLLGNSGVISNLETFEAGIFKREQQSSTGVGEGIAIPHCKSEVVKKPHLAAMVIKEGVDFDSLDGEKVNLLFMIAAPISKDNVHLDVLARLSTMLMQEDFKKNLLACTTKEQFLDVINKAEVEKKEAEKAAAAPKFPRILAATACPTGIAHTYMAKEALEKAAKELNITIKVETNGSAGTKNALTAEEIEHADTIIVAADAFVEMERFTGKRVIQCSTSKVIHAPKEMLNAALGPSVPIYNPGKPKTMVEGATGDQFIKSKNQSGRAHTFYRHMMSGISHMIPFVVAGGILLAIAYLIDTASGVTPELLIRTYGEKYPDIASKFGSWTLGAQVFHILGADLALGLMFPVVGGFIAYSIAGRPGIVSGFVGGFAAKTGAFSLAYLIEAAQHGLTPIDDPTPLMNTLLANSAGFVGAIVAGFLAGFYVNQMKKWFEKLPRTLQGVKDMIIVPLLSVIFIGMSMFLINVPLSYMNYGISLGIQKLARFTFIVALVGALVSALMAIDMGGPINKATHYAVLAVLTTAIESGADLTIPQQLMAANIVGIMVPPVMIALCT
ncbi:MAG: fructose-specific PTS transporter subunit EIIC [Mycoplasmoidaceae bacterium]|nr:fructose-specific PTS transporter subunit EIIC [Mycoplasmoidaceae bacterium]